MLKSTLEEINTSLRVNLTKNDVRFWKMKILRFFPAILKQWKKIRAPSHQTALIGAVIRIMNQELVLYTLTPKESFKVKQTALQIARKFIHSPKARGVKNIEVWAQAVCAKALRDCGHTKGNDFELFFPKLPPNVLKTISNKRWQLDTLLH